MTSSTVISRRENSRGAFAAGVRVERLVWGFGILYRSLM
jgi:hypothetical protein